MPLMQLLYRTEAAASSPSGCFASWSGSIAMSIVYHTQDRMPAPERR